MIPRSDLCIDLLRHRPEIAVLDRTEDVDDRLRVVVTDDRRPERTRNAGKAAEKLRLRSRGDRHVLQILQRRHAVLRRLGDQRVLQARLRIEPESRRDLSTAGQGQQQVIGDIVLTDSQLLRPVAIGGDVQLRLVEDLLHAQIDEARHMP